MGIRATRDVTRAEVLERIKYIDSLAINSEFRLVEATTHEDGGLEHFVSNFQANHVNIDKYTNTMLEAIMDLPFYRYSMFDNYIIVGEE